MNMAHAQDYEYDDFEDEEFDEFDEFDDTYDDTPYDDDEADYAVDETDYAVDDTAATPALFRGDVQSSLANLVRISPNINPDQAFVLRAVAAAIATVVQQCQQQQQQQQLTQQQQQQLLLQQHNQRTSAGQLQAQAVQSIRHHHTNTNGNHNGHHIQAMTTTTTTVSNQTPSQQHTPHPKQRKQSHPSSNQSAKKQQQQLAANQQQQHNSHHHQQQPKREQKHSEQDLAYASSSGVDVETLKTIREFAEELKTRRKFIRLSQKGAAQSLRHFTSGEQPCTDAIIYHFENLQMEPERAIQLIPLLRDWLNWAELQRKSGKQLVLMPAVTKVPRERKRKVVLFNEVAKQHLEASFAKNNHPDKWELDILAEELSIPTRSIRKWFTNRRQRKRFAEKFSP